jgi:hypothetical protein
LIVDTWSLSTGKLTRGIQDFLFASDSVIPTINPTKANISGQRVESVVAWPAKVKTGLGIVVTL